MKHWNARQRSIAEIAWPSFLAACVATLVFFAEFDPGLLHGTFIFRTDISHSQAYTIGFFFFWLIAALASGLTNWLIRSERRKSDFPTQSNGH